VVDAYGPEEQAMGWYYYLEDKIRSPFGPGASFPKWYQRSEKKGETVKVRSEEACSSDMLVVIRWQSRDMAVPLSQLTAL
jgi:hypothetical protein